MKVLFIVSAGAADPTTASVPIHLAVNGALEAGQDPTIVLAGNAADLLLGDNPQTLEGIGIPPLRDLLAKARDHAVPVYV